MIKLIRHTAQPVLALVIGVSSAAAQGQYPVSVTPDAGLVSVTGGGSGAQAFTITNFGNTAANYTVSVSCSGNLPTCGGPAMVSVAAGASTTIGVSYTAGTGLGSGRILVRASAGGSAPAADSGWLNVGVAVGGQAAPVVEVGAVNPNGTLARGGCFTAGGAPAVMYECGAFVTAHALPSLRTLGKERAPTLVYNSETAHPVLLISADVGLPSYAVTPDSVSAALTFNTYRQPLPVGIGTLAPGTVRRAAFSYDPGNVATGLYSYTLEVRFWYGTTYRATTADGKVAVVNTGGSPLGAGWSLAGLSYVVPSGSDLLWVDGDGSTTVFHSTGVTGHWIGDALGRPDSLYTNAQGYIERDLKGGGKILLDANWREVTAVNRLGIGTTFEYDGSGRLAHIRTAHVLASGGWDPHLSYDFTYGNPRDNNPQAQLSAVQAPGPTPGTTRSVSFGADGAGHLVSITDSDGSVEQFAYDGPLPHMLSLVTDARGSKTALGYTNPARTAWSVTRYGGGSVRNSQDVQVTYVDPRAWPLNYGLLDPAAWPGVYDGARTDTADVVRVWLDRLGQPTKIRDPRFNETYITRADPRFPALVTQLDAPGAGGAPGGSVQGVGPRRVSLAYFNARGGMDSAVVKNPLGDGRNAVAKYAYDTAWPDFISQVTSPTGLVSSTGYDPATGNRLWQQVGTDASRRVSFSYNGLGQVTSARSQRAVTAGEAPDSMEYTSTLANLTAVTSPLGMRTTFVQDLIGRDTLTITPISVAYSDSVVVRRDLLGRDTLTLSIGPGSRFLGVPKPLRQVLEVRKTYDAGGLPLSLARGELGKPQSTVTTWWRYDPLGRQIAEVAPDSTPTDTTNNPRTRIHYDVAGNADTVITRRGDTLSMTYDPLNRLKTRRTSAFHYASRTAGIAVADLAISHSEENGPYPRYPNDGADGYVIPSDTAMFGYDAAGNVVEADNHDARVSRAYYPAGALASETQRINTWAGADFTQHVFTLTYSYDLEGRRTALNHPANIAPVAAGVIKSLQTYDYDLVTGALAHVTDPLGNVFGFGYDEDGRNTSIAGPGASEGYRFNADGLLVRQQTWRNTPSPPLIRDDTFTYDRRGKMVSGINRLGRTDSLAFAYSPLGMLTSSQLVTRGKSAVGDSIRFQSTEGFAYDALANTLVASTTTQVDSSTSGGSPVFGSGHGLSQVTATDSSGYLPYTGRLAFQLQTGFQQYFGTSFSYDTKGNVEFSSSVPQYYLTQSLTDRASYYGADGKLRAADWRNVPNYNQEPSTLYTAFEEYRYDALGRRVEVRSRKYCELAISDPSYSYPDLCRMGTIRRTVWDGDRELYEIQMPGYNETPAAALENDTQPAQPVGYGGTYVDLYPFFGRVAYVNGPGMDQPLGLIRIDYQDKPSSADTVWRWQPFLINPTWNQRGEPDNGFYPQGDNLNCRTSGTHARCVSLDWPFRWFAYFRSDYKPAAWHGTLIEDKRDGSALDYRRHRYYDPATGRFTQEDPMGIAGGLNTYGFAEGDPVSYSDPYGLTVCFYGPSRQRLIDATSDAIGAPVPVDKGGCVTTDAKPSHGRGSILLARFNDLARSSNVYVVSDYPDDLCFQPHSHFCPDDRKAYIETGSGSDGDDGRRFSHDYWGCGFFGTFTPDSWKKVTESLGSIIAHELLGHGWNYETGGPGYSEIHAIEAENLYHRAHGERDRCVTNW